MKKLLLKTVWFYKYGCAILLFLVMVLSYLNYFTSYNLYYNYLREIIGFSLFFCYRELYTCYYGFKEKCKWQKSTIWGLTSYCTVNLIFMNNLKEEYISIIHVIGLSVFFAASIYYIYKEEIKNYATQSK